MRTTTYFERLMPTTTNGHAVRVITVYSSFNEDEIKELTNHLQETIGTCVYSIEQEVKNGNNIQ